MRHSPFFKANGRAVDHDNWNAKSRLSDASPFSFFCDVIVWDHQQGKAGERMSFLEFIGSNLPLVLALIGGVGLLVVEIFMPGIGIPGISGVILIGTAIVLVWINYGPVAGIWMCLGAVVLMAVALTFSLKTASGGAFFRKWGLKELEKKAPANDLETFIGRTGSAATPLRPSGIGDFDGVRLNVISEGSFIRKDAAVRIVNIEGNRIVVREEN